MKASCDWFSIRFLSRHARRLSKHSTINLSRHLLGQNRARVCRDLFQLLIPCFWILTMMFSCNRLSWKLVSMRLEIVSMIAIKNRIPSTRVGHQPTFNVTILFGNFHLKLNCTLNVLCERFADVLGKGFVNANGKTVACTNTEDFWT